MKVKLFSAIVALILLLCGCGNQSVDSSKEPSAVETDFSSERAQKIDGLVDYVVEHGASNPKGTAFTVADEESGVEIVAYPSQYPMVSFRWNGGERALEPSCYTSDTTVQHENGGLTFQVTEDGVACYYYANFAFLKNGADGSWNLKAEIDVSNEFLLDSIELKPVTELSDSPFSVDSAEILSCCNQTSKDFIKDVSGLLNALDCGITMQDLGIAVE